MMMRPAIYWSCILSLGVIGQDVSARASSILGHEASSFDRERESLRNERLYESLVAERSHNPAQFDRAHWVLGEMFTKPGSFEYWFNRWQTDTARFEHWHHRFWRIIDGEAMHLDRFHLTPLISPGGPVGNSSPPITFTPDSLNTPNPPATSTITSAVPEPTSLCLFLVSFGLLALARGGSAYLRKAA
jgi:hypothetical protein